MWCFFTFTIQRQIQDFSGEMPTDYLAKICVQGPKFYYVDPPQRLDY